MKTYTQSSLDIAKIQSDLRQAKVIIMRLERENADLVKQQQCLAEIKAEAGRAGFIEGYNTGYVDYKTTGIVMPISKSDEYAAKIRNTGTWLKDSNVNGGKRQGVE